MQKIPTDTQLVGMVDSYHGSLPDIHFDDEVTGGRAVAWIRFGDTITKPQGSGLYSRGIMDELERYCVGGLWIPDQVGDGPSRVQ